MEKTNKKNSSLTVNLAAWILLIPSCLCVAAIVIRPAILSFLWSFFNMKGFNVLGFCEIENYKRVLTDGVFLQALGNTVKYVLWSLVVGAALPFIVAVVMNEMLHFRKFTRTMVYLPGIMPAVAVSLLWYFMFYPDQSGLLNLILGKFGIEPYVWLQDSRFTILYIIISMTWQGMGGTAIYYFAGLQGINREMYEAALIDGAGYFRRILTVTIPQMSGMLLLFLMRQCIAVFNIVDQPLQMTGGGPNNASVTLGLLNYRYAFQMYRPQFAMALGCMMSVVMIIGAVLYMKADQRNDNNRM